MQVSTLWQPFAANGSYASLGQVALAEVMTGVYRRLRICVAYVTSSGTSRVFGPLRDLVVAGGTAHIYVGLRNGVTSLQAVQHLLSTGATVFGCDTRRSVLFHPKVYLLDGPDAAWLAVGSSNLTREGLFRNYETSTLVKLDLTIAADTAYLASYDAWFASLPRVIEDCSQIRLADLPALLADGRLIDELVRPEIERQEATPTPRRPGAARVVVVIPPAPPPHPDAGMVRRPRRAANAAPRVPRRVAARKARHFAMWLSDFDTSHRRNTPGTPEISLPESAVGFLPRVTRGARAYPDAYFNILLNDPTGSSQVVQYRLWQRPPGARVGHADWRINVKHDTIDLTNPAGGDIILFERLPVGSRPAYEVWIVHPGDPTYNALLTRCDQEVQAAGHAGRKRYGLF